MKRAPKPQPLWETEHESGTSTQEAGKGNDFLAA